MNNLISITGANCTNTVEAIDFKKVEPLIRVVFRVTLKCDSVELTHRIEIESNDEIYLCDKESYILGMKKQAVLNAKALTNFNLVKLQNSMSEKNEKRKVTSSVKANFFENGRKVKFDLENL